MEVTNEGLLVAHLYEGRPMEEFYLRQALWAKAAERADERGGRLLLSMNEALAVIHDNQSIVDDYLEALAVAEKTEK